MSDLGGDGFGGIGAFIRQAIGEGRSLTSTRAAFREAGLGAMSNATFGQLFGQVRAAMGAAGELADIAYDLVPDPNMLTPWAAGTGGKFSSFVEVLVREPGSRDVSSRFHQYVTSDPHSPQEAVDAAMDVITQASMNQGTDFEAVVLDGIVTSMTRTVARR